MRDMAKLRLIAIFSNIAFIVYALSANLIPVLALHLILLLINMYALSAMRAEDDTQSSWHRPNMALKEHPLTKFNQVRAVHKS